MDCHDDLNTNAVKDWRNSAHAKADDPVGCADCHAGQHRSSKKVLNHFLGKIDSDEKYMQHRREMKAIEIARLQADDSQECRNCHDEERWNGNTQTSRARQAHFKENSSTTCLDCHEGLVQSPGG